MRCIRHFAISMMATAMIACSGILYMDDVVIAHYGELEQDHALALDLLHYDHRYVLSRVPSLTARGLEGVRIQAFRSDSGRASMRITLDLRDEYLAENREQIMMEFTAMYTDLIAWHLAALPEFDAHLASAEGYADELFSADIPALLDSASPVLYRYSGRTAVRDALVQIRQQLGEPTSLEFSRAQKYPVIDDVPPSYTYFFQATFEGREEPVMLRVSILEEDGEMRLLGFGL